MAASNTWECFRECIGRQVTAVLRHRPANTEIFNEYRTLIFDDGTGLTICDNGAYFRRSADEIQRLVRIVRDHLAAVTHDLGEALAADGIVLRAALTAAPPAGTAEPEKL